MTRRHVIGFLALLLAALPLSARAEDTARVTRIQGQAEAIATAGTRPLAAGDPVHSGDRLRTGASARLQLRFADGMELTLSDGAEMTVEDFTWTPATNTGSAALRLAQGAFLVESGKVGKLPDHPLVVKTPVASVGVRGTRFWGGSLDSPLNVLLLDGRIAVTNPAGSVELGEVGSGTNVEAAGAAPSAPSFWGQERIQRAFATVSFEK